MYEAFFTATMEQQGLNTLQCQTCNIEEGLPSWESRPFLVKSRRGMCYCILKEVLPRYADCRGYPQGDSWQKADRR